MSGDIQTIHNLDELNDFAREVLAGLEKSHAVSPAKSGGRATVLALSGDLGAGKTTFTQNLAQILNIENHITSPTFVIQKSYAVPVSAQSLFKTLVHIDAYRLDSSEELRAIGFERELKNPENLIVIEWPERVPEVIPEYATKLNFSFIDENTRTVETSR